MSGQEPSHLAAYEAIVERFVSWASAEPAIEAAMIIGSRARADHPADAWSDLDIAVFTTNPERLIAETDWLSAIGSPVITYIEPTAVGSWQERRVLFEEARDVDVAAVPADLLSILKELPPDDALYEELASVVRRGYRILIDRHGQLASLLPAMSAPSRTVPMQPGQEDITETLNNFWYQCVWIAKKLRRGEITAAHECLVGHQRWLLMRLVRWHAQRSGTVWHRTRFIEEWADPHLVEQMAATWALHDVASIQRALTEMMDLVSWLAGEIAATHALIVPVASESAARKWVREISLT